MYDERTAVTKQQSWQATLLEGYLPNLRQRDTSTVSANSEVGYVKSWRGKRRVKDAYGWIPPNEFTLLKGSFECVPNGGVLKQHALVGGQQYIADIDYNSLFAYYRLAAMQPNVSIPTPEMFPDMGEHALRQAQAEAWGEVNGPDCPGLTWIGESRETFVWIRDILRGVVRATISYQASIKTIQKVGRSASEIADGLASLWLQYRYALTPLMFQLEEAVGLLTEAKRELATVTGYVKRRNTTSESRSTLYWGGLVIEVTTEEYLDFRGACKLYPTAIREGFDWGFKPFDLIGTAYELTKLSFVLDWIIDVGGFISAWRPGDAKIAYQSNTIVVNLVREIRTRLIRHTYDSSFYEVSYTPETVRHSRTWIRRTTNVERPLVPAFNVEALSLMRQIDAVSLSFQMLKGLIKKR